MKIDINHWLMKAMLVSVFLMVIAVIFIKPQPKPPFPGIPTSPSAPQDHVLVYFAQEKNNNTQVTGVDEHLPRQMQGSELLKTAMQLLAAGPNNTEKRQGFYSEIPKKTTLKVSHGPHNTLVISVSPSFAEGGGSNSMQSRLDQVVKTVISTHQTVPVYLHMNGKQLTVLGGEGVEVNQPINAKPPQAN